MTIYKIEFNVPDSNHKQDIVNILPALSLTVGSEVKLTPHGIMQFVRVATRDLLGSLVGCPIDAFENQNVWNAYTDQSGLIVLDFKIKGEVDSPDHWHTIADPISVISNLMLALSEESNKNLQCYYFDWQLPSIYCEASTDYDHDVQASGSVNLNTLTGGLEFSFMKACKQVECLSAFPKVQALVQNMISKQDFEYDSTKN